MTVNLCGFLKVGGFVGKLKDALETILNVNLRGFPKAGELVGRLNVSVSASFCLCLCLRDSKLPNSDPLESELRDSELRN